jgi:uncharacterized protein YndB with AHSA1/START domain
MNHLSTSRTDTITIQVSHQYSTSPARVFDAWLDPQQARAFLFATPEGEVVRAEIDPRVGGRFTIVDRRAGGDAAHYGEYLEIDRPHRLVFRFSVEPDTTSGDLITIQIAPTDDGCLLTLTHAMKPEWAEYIDQTRAGWEGILVGLAGVVMRNG